MKKAERIARKVLREIDTFPGEGKVQADCTLYGGFCMHNVCSVADLQAMASALAPNWKPKVKADEFPGEVA